MKNKLLFFCFGLMLISACEKDDFCLQNPVTPKLILRFYDTNSMLETKSAERFSAIATSKMDSLVSSIATLDSIAIPLNPNANQTIYTFKKNNTSGNIADNEIATLTIDYVVNQDYVSRSCGFRAEFTDLVLTIDNGWISSITPSNLENINTQNTAHVQVFH